MRVALTLVLAIVVACKDSAPAKPTTGPVASGSGSSGSAAQPDLATFLEQIRAEAKLPALAAGVWRNGKLVELAAVGARKLTDPSQKVTANDRWHLGSNTKAMTATLIGIFVDRGAVRWTDTISTLFRGDKIDPGYAGVTLDQLVRHEGGAPAQPPDTLEKQLWADADKADARKNFVAGILAKAPAQAPGTFVYSNTGYLIAAAALERATAKRWDDLIRTELFDKLGMTSCGFGAPTGDQPWGHDDADTPIAPGPAADNPPGLGPAGTVHCTLEDYGKFLALHSTGEPALVTPETMQHLHTPRPPNTYAGGWLVIANTKGSLLAHSGSNTMWYATALVALAPEPQNKLVFVMATNSGKSTIESVFPQLVGRHIKK